MRAPAAIVISRASGHDTPMLTMSTAAIAPVTATTEPTDRSMCPAMMIRIIPIARIRMYEFCTMMFEMFCGCSNAPSVSTANSTMISANATKMPLWRRFSENRVDGPPAGLPRLTPSALTATSALVGAAMPHPTLCGL